MAWFLGQSLVFLVLAFALGLLVGWLLWGRRTTVPRSSRDPFSQSRPAPDVARPVPPAPTAAVADPEPEPVAVEEADADLELAPEPAAEPVPVAESEPVAEPEPVAESEPVAEPEPVAGTEPVQDEPVAAAGQPQPVATQLFTDADLGPMVEPEGPVSAARPVDDLKRIEGIGPKISSVLADAGILTFAQLADLDRISLTEILTSGGVKFAPSLSTWSEQARLLAAGDEAAFAELTSQLVAGRRGR